ncbi:hypothetical protein [Amycolatopsis azurea]|uniref:Uncharacterized protein n=1 Tax=Amycolatopsis azurea DSM 43854 TaxID=1238180 RepID=M2QIV7_9PSEU|nr:hypothetical protein [Amycolatopsis azurea]EMD26646.1 hypothetical protein C791_3306 [Amycolatopsis azurea DSM 43854]OOC01078.1 hypothetical protein B0293_39865 [Amycolatopsis azurea DSM 43854]
MNRSTAAVANAFFLFAGVAGLIIQIASGVPGFPDIPPGPFILGITGILVLTLSARFRWILFLGIVAPVFILVGALLEGSFWGRLADVGDFGPFVGTVLLIGGVIAAAISGVVAVSQAYHRVAVR